MAQQNWHGFEGLTGEALVSRIIVAHLALNVVIIARVMGVPIAQLLGLLSQVGG